MRISILLLICLSLLSCIDNPKLPPRPDGWNCTYSTQFKKFYCNRLSNPDEQLDLTVESLEIDKAQCMPLETFERYQSYVQELKDIADRECFKTP